MRPHSRSLDARAPRIRAATTAALTIAAAWLAVLVPEHAPAQVPPDTTRPFIDGGVYDKPYLTTLLGRAAIGGYAEAHAVWQQVDGITEEAGFLAKRFNLFTAARISDFVRIGAELEFEEGAEEILLEFAAIDLTLHPAITLRGGMILSPLGRFNLSHDSPRNEFTDRPLVSTELLGVALSEPGFGLLGALPIGPGGRVTYEVYAVNGFDDDLITEAEDGTRLPLGKRNFEDNNDAPAVVGRLAWSPSLDIELGVSAHHGAYNRSNLDGARIDETRTLTIWVADADLQAGPLRLSGEAATAGLDVPPTLEGIFASSQRGLYAETLFDFGHGWLRTMPRSFFSAKARLDIADFDADRGGDMVRQITVGINFRPTRDTVVKAGYIRGVSRDRFNNPADHAGLRFSLATYF